MKKHTLFLFFTLSFISLKAQVNTPLLSVDSGFYQEEFYLSISHPDPAAIIIYTTDGSIPDLDNTQAILYNYKNSYTEAPEDQDGPLLQDSFRTLIYTDPILISDRSTVPNKIAAISTTYQNQPNFPITPVFKSTVIRTRAVINSEYSEVITKNYFVTPEGQNKYTLPIISLNIDPYKLYSYEYGLNVAGIMFDQWRENNPDEVAGQWASGNYWMSGGSSELELNFSYITNGVEVLNHNAGLRNHGNGSRYMPNRSVRLYAKNGYGVSRFNYNFFDNYDYDSFKRIILRNSGNDASKTMFRDAFVQQLVKHLNVEIQEYQPVVVFINSEYNGIYNLRERFDEHYFNRVFGVDEDEVDYLENTGIASGVVDLGDDVHYFSMINFLENNSLEDDSNFDYVSTLIDPIDYTDYCITYIFTSNYDWPHNNNEYWRKRVAYTPDAPYGQDGRWRWLVKDMDYSYGLWDWDNGMHNTLESATAIYDETQPNYEVYNKSTLILRKLLENENYKVFFINRFADLINTTFTASRGIQVISDMQSVLEPEIEEHIHRWSMIPSFSIWESNVNKMKDIAQSRPNTQIAHIKQKFNIDETHEIIVDVSHETHGYIKINTIDILPSTVGISENPYPWTGGYFKNIPITLTAIPAEGYVFSHWLGTVEGEQGEQLIISPESNVYAKAVFIQENSNISEHDKFFDVQVFPNPFEDIIYVISDQYGIEYNLLSIDGKLIKKGNLNNLTMNLENLQGGMYILKFRNGKEQVTKKIIKR